MNDRHSSAAAGEAEAPDFLAGGGETGALMRARNWSATPLGPAALWPQSLKTCVRIVLTSRQPMFVWWGDALINLYNDAYRAIVGGKHPQALGQPAAVVWREIWDQVGPRAESAMRNNEGTYDEALLLIMERYGYPEETYYTFSYSPVPNDQGGIGGIICANTDDTQRIIGERQLALLSELATRTADARTIGDACRLSARALETNARDLPFGLIYLVDPDRGRVVLAGRAGMAAGHAAAPDTVDLDDASLWPFAEVIRSNAVTVVADLDTRFGVLPTGAWDRPPIEAALLPIAPQGQTGQAGILVAGLNPFRLFDDGYRGFLGLVSGQIAAGIANAQAYEEERRRAEALAEIDRAKTAFFSNASHEFRTPLTLMLGPLEDMLARRPRSGTVPAERREVELVHRNGLRLLKLVNTLLDFSRIEAGRIQAVYEPLDLAAYTADLASTFRSAMDKAGLRYVVDCPPLPQPAYVDRDMWEKIVLNLISNAFKYTLQGEIAVSLRATADGRAELSVRDTGVGIPEHELPRLFERFHRIEGQRGRTHEGTGIGLALVQELTRLHGGTVDVESSPGHGSTFTVSVPLGHAHLPSDRIGAARTLSSTGVRADAFVEEALRWLPGEDTMPELLFDKELVGPDLGAPPAEDRPRVLLADDNADMRDYVSRLLEARYEVVAVPDGQVALEAARRRRPDLVLSDVMMPRLDGFGLLQALRADPDLDDVPVVLLSARAGEEARAEGLEAGADDYLTKPFSARELLARIGSNLNLAQIRRHAAQVLRAQKAELEAVLETVPAAVWFTYDPDAREIRSNRFGAQLLRMRETDNPSLTAPDGPRHFRVFRRGLEARPETLPLQRAARGEEVRSDEFEVRFRDGTSTFLLAHGTPLRDEQGHVVGAVTAAVDISERMQAEQRQHLLIHELNHRVKNTLAVIQALASQTLRTTDSSEGFAEAFRARVSALAHAHDLLTRESWEGVALGELASSVLAPHQTGEGRFHLEGPPVRLQPKAALSFAMAFHELATNAVKYGALSQPGGRVDIRWTVAEAGADRRLLLKWQESGGPTVSAPRRMGFGSRLIERGLARELNGDVRLVYEPTGVMCIIDAPLAEIEIEQSRAA